MKYGFDNDKYIALQSQHIKERIAYFGGKLYLEFGGKLFDDYHASRVLPGFEPDSKIKMLLKLRAIAEILVVISANDIVKNKYRSDLGITYDADVIRLIDIFKSKGLYVGSVVVNMYQPQPAVDGFIKRLRLSKKNTSRTTNRLWTQTLRGLKCYFGTNIANVIYIIVLCKKKKTNILKVFLKTTSIWRFHI